MSPRDSIESFMERRLALPVKTDIAWALGLEDGPLYIKHPATPGAPGLGYLHSILC